MSEDLKDIPLWDIDREEVEELAEIASGELGLNQKQIEIMLTTMVTARDKAREETPSYCPNCGEEL